MTGNRQGYANGTKPKTLNTRVGRVNLRIPQIRGYHDENGLPFYPRSLERGVGSEWAMTLAVAEMRVQGVSTRKVTAIVQELCGLDIPSTRVSRAAAEPDDQLTAWLEKNVTEALAVLWIPASRRQPLRTTNATSSSTRSSTRRSNAERA